jgi:threonine/homoserine/homoserine lactone efflux protein
MNALSTEYWSDHILMAIMIVAACMFVVSAVADRRRTLRQDINDVGFMPWTDITFGCILVTLIAGVLAYKAS